MNTLPEPDGPWSRSDAQSQARRGRLAALQRSESLNIQSEAGLLAPRSLDELAEIPGIGASKLERYGDELLKLTRNTC